jgi:membrane-associated phospholipid phosphatase
MVLGNPRDRQMAGDFSNVGLVALGAWPALVDAGLTAAIWRRSPGIATRMLVIDAQAYAFTEIATGTIKHLADRARPSAVACREDPSHDPSCETAGGHHSFPSGHTSVSFTGAGLVCVHHTQLGLLGPEGDALSCVTALTLASAVGITRIAADKHYATDVLAGAGLGLLSGAAMPYLLYYAPAWRPPTLELGGGVVVPAVSPRFAGVSYAGVF